MTEDEGSQQRHNSPVPAPDPTARTKESVDEAADQWRRDIKALRDELTGRLDSMDKATAIRMDQFKRMWPAEVEKLIQHQELINSRDIATINQRFEERDKRTEQAASAAQKAIDAALMAAAHLVAQQNDANARASEKVEANQTKLIDGLQTLIANSFAASDAKIADLKERFAGNQGSDHGRSTLIASGVAVIGMVIAVAAIIVSIVVGRV